MRCSRSGFLYLDYVPSFHSSICLAHLLGLDLPLRATPATQSVSNRVSAYFAYSAVTGVLGLFPIAALVRPKRPARTGLRSSYPAATKRLRSGGPDDRRSK